MLIQDFSIFRPDPVLAMIAVMHGASPTPVQLRPGVYELGHFGGSHFLPEFEHYPETTVGPYGVCDSVDQLLASCPELEASDRRFVVTVTPIRKRDQPAQGGWRWHKWGEYIGVQRPQCEYLHDEPEIEEVLVFHIYEKV